MQSGSGVGTMQRIRDLVLVTGSTCRITILMSWVACFPALTPRRNLQVPTSLVLSFLIHKLGTAIFPLATSWGGLPRLGKLT